MRYHRSTMVLRGRDSDPAAALSGPLFLKPPALPWLYPALKTVGHGLALMP